MTLQEAKQELQFRKSLIGQKTKTGEIVKGLFIVPADNSKIGKFISLAYQSESLEYAAEQLQVNDFQIIVLYSDFHNHVAFVYEPLGVAFPN